MKISCAKRCELRKRYLPTAGPGRRNRPLPRLSGGRAEDRGGGMAASPGAPLRLLPLFQARQDREQRSAERGKESRQRRRKLERAHPGQEMKMAVSANRLELL